ncbi:ferritin-like domain-containing protein [Ciceribacter selenitireducens]|uniref:ferritin-like domain-containing protein n=1 Tax=Ciceribacter selenitireducens TaxID=448181 RepID=UPI0004B7C4D9|nr:DUF2202 domain-containing protein [Ciceribacter selenitireducens]
MSRMTLSIIAAGLIAVTTIGTTAKAATLTDGARTAIEAALEDEHRAEAFYAAVMAKFGEVRPFSNIIRAEQTHASELNALLQNYGLDQKTTNPHLGSAEFAALVPETLAEACKMGVDAEIANRDLYDKKLMPAVQDYADVQIVFTALRDASENKHLPAFERCGGGQGQGMGQGMGQGQGHGQGMGMGHGKNATQP